MSGVIKGVKKVFRKVVKVAKKVLPIALGVAAIYFTVGAALGVPGTAGGWGGAVSGLTEKLGLGSTLSSVLTGAVTQAGYGSLIGGGLAAVSGGDVRKGLLTGALAGAATGGVMGGLGLPTDPFKGIGEATTAPSTLSGGAGQETLIGAGGQPQQSGPQGTFTSEGYIPAGDPGPSSGGLQSRIGKFASTPGGGAIIGGAIKGLGAGIGAYAQADADVEAAKLRADQEEAERERIAANFGTGSGGGLLTGTSFDTTARPTPTQQFHPANRLAKTRGAMWRYNPETGQLELTPTA